MSQFDRRQYIQTQMRTISPPAQLAFAAAVAERLLPAAETPLTSWRKDAWLTHRRALDKIWDYLEGSRLSKFEYEKLRDDCIEQLPHDEDPEWQGGLGGFEAGAAVTYALDVLIDSNSENAARASNQIFNAMREFLIGKMFPNARTHRDLNEDAIFESQLFTLEMDMQNKHLALLTKSELNDDEFASSLRQIKEDSKRNPVSLTGN